MRSYALLSSCQQQHKLLHLKHRGFSWPWIYHLQSKLCWTEFASLPTSSTWCLKYITMRDSHKFGKLLIFSSIIWIESWIQFASLFFFKFTNASWQTDTRYLGHLSRMSYSEPARKNRVNSSEKMHLVSTKLISTFVQGTKGSQKSAKYLLTSGFLWTPHRLEPQHRGTAPHWHLLFNGTLWELPLSLFLFRNSESSRM